MLSPQLWLFFFNAGFCSQKLGHSHYTCLLQSYSNLLPSVRAGEAACRQPSGQGAAGAGLPGVRVLRIRHCRQLSHSEGRLEGMATPGDPLKAHPGRRTGALQDPTAMPPVPGDPFLPPSRDATALATASRLSRGAGSSKPGFFFLKIGVWGGKGGCGVSPALPRHWGVTGCHHYGASGSHTSLYIHIYRMYTYLDLGVSFPYKPCFHWLVGTALPGKSFLFFFLSFLNQQLIPSYQRGEACPDDGVC